MSLDDILLVVEKLLPPAPVGQEWTSSCLYEHVVWSLLTKTNGGGFWETLSMITTEDRTEVEVRTNTSKSLIDLADPDFTEKLKVLVDQAAVFSPPTLGDLFGAERGV